MKIKLADSQSEYFGLVQLRKNVFINEQSVPIDLEMDKQDLTALHFVVIDENEVVATCRLVIEKDYGKLGRMAVKKQYRYKDIGSKLISYVEQHACLIDISTIRLEAQTQAIDFYLANGYHVTSDIFYDANIPHKMMEKTL